MIPVHGAVGPGVGGQAVGAFWSACPLAEVTDLGWSGRLPWAVDIRWMIGIGRRIVRRMPRVQVYLPEDLHEQLKQRDLPASELLQVALRAELERQDSLAETDRYLEELATEVGEPSQRQRATAEAIARRIRDRSLDQVG